MRAVLTMFTMRECNLMPPVLPSFSLFRPSCPPVLPSSPTPSNLRGLQDENVHFHNTAKLVDALINVGKPYNLQVSALPGRHTCAVTFCDRVLCASVRVNLCVGVVL